MDNIDRAAALQAAKTLLPGLENSQVAIAAPGNGEGFWVGASSAVEYDGIIYMAYRLRQPIALGRGQGVVIARSTDGVNFETLTMIDKTSMDAESLERPTLLRTPDGLWRLYLSCATTGTKHWRVELLEATSPDAFDTSTRRVVMPGDEHWAVKDTVIKHYDDMYHCWATFHPLNDKDQEDRMWSKYALSEDGIDWHWQEGFCLSPRDGKWDSRGARITALQDMGDYLLAFYDGRASASENYEERTGVAIGITPSLFESISDEVFAESALGRGLRYVDLVPLASNGTRAYYEVAKDDGSHELRTNKLSTAT